MCVWLGISTSSSFVQLQPNQIAAFKWETLQLNLADELTVFLWRCYCQISRLLGKKHSIYE